MTPKEELEQLRREQGNIPNVASTTKSPHQELEELRAEQGNVTPDTQPSFKDTLLKNLTGLVGNNNAPTNPSASTDVAINPVISRPATMGQRDLSITNLDDIKEAAQRVVGGLASGASLGLSDRVLYPDQQDFTEQPPSYDIAKFIGMVAPWSLAEKGVVAGIPALARGGEGILKNLMKGVGRGVLTGGTIGAAEELVKPLDQKINPMNIAKTAGTVAVLEGGLSALGPVYKAIGSFLRNKKYAEAKQLYDAAVAKVGEQARDPKIEQALAEFRQPKEVPKQLPVPEGLADNFTFRDRGMGEVFPSERPALPFPEGKGEGFEMVGNAKTRNIKNAKGQEFRPSGFNPDLVEAELTNSVIIKKGEPLYRSENGSPRGNVIGLKTLGDGKYFSKTKEVAEIYGNPKTYFSDRDLNILDIKSNEIYDIKRKIISENKFNSKEEFERFVGEEARKRGYDGIDGGGIEGIVIFDQSLISPPSTGKVLGGKVGRKEVRPTSKQAKINAQSAAKARESQIFKETQDKFAEESANTETITQRENRRKTELPPSAKAKEAWEMTREEFERTVNQRNPLSSDVKRNNIFKASIEADKIAKEHTKNIQRFIPKSEDVSNLSDELGIDLYPGNHKYWVAKAIKEGRPVPASVLAEYPELAAKHPPTANKSSGIRAKIGGEMGGNGYFYKGGQFLPSTKEPPGTYKFTKGNKGTGKIEVAPYDWSYRPTETAEPIYRPISAYVKYDKNTKTIKLIDGVNRFDGTTGAREIVTPDTPVAKGDLTFREYIDAFNNGQRWFDKSSQPPPTATGKPVGKVETGKGKSTLGALTGATGGFEYDEKEKKWKYNPALGLAGAAAGGLAMALTPGQKIRAERAAARGEVPLPPKLQMGEPPITAANEAAVNLNRLNLDQEAKNKISRASQVLSPELEKVKGGKLTNAEIIEKAKESEMLGRVTTREETAQMAASVLAARQNMSKLAESPGMAKDFLENLKTVSAAATDMGRNLQKLSIDAEPGLAQTKIDLAKKLLDAGVDIDKIEAAAKDVNFNDQKQVTAFFRQFVPPTFWEKLDVYRYGNILSSPKTHIVNAASNLLQVAGVRPVLRLTTGAVDFVSSGLSGKTREYYVGQVPAYYKGMFNSMGKAFGDAVETIKGKKIVERPDIEHIPTGSKWLAGHQSVMNMLEAGDVFFRTLATAGEEEALAYRNIKGGKQLSSIQIQLQAKTKAAETIFRGELDPKNKLGQGFLLSGIDQFTNAAYQFRRVPGGKWIIPFIKTPMNILKQGVEYSPMGFLTVPGNVLKKEQAAKAIVGSAVFGGASMIAFSGNSTWSIPRGKKQKEAFYAAGMKPYAIKMGGKWISYSRLGPLAYPIAMAAAMKYYYEDAPDALSEEKMSKAGDVFVGLAQFFSDQSYLQGIKQAIDAISTSYGRAGLVGSISSQLVPMSSLQRWVTQIVDPIYRKTDKDFSPKAIVEKVKAGIPGLSKDLPAYKDVGDQPSKRKNMPFNAFSPVEITPENKQGETDYKTLQQKNQLDRLVTFLRDAVKAGTMTEAQANERYNKELNKVTR
jgi:hypothetical protein